jgi:hypothetical protein
VNESGFLHHFFSHRGKTLSDRPNAAMCFAKNGARFQIAFLCTAPVVIELGRVRTAAMDRKF